MLRYRYNESIVSSLRLGKHWELITVVAEVVVLANSMEQSRHLIHGRSLSCGGLHARQSDFENLQHFAVNPLSSKGAVQGIRNAAAGDQHPDPLDQSALEVTVDYIHGFSRSDKLQEHDAEAIDITPHGGHEGADIFRRHIAHVAEVATDGSVDVCINRFHDTRETEVGDPGLEFIVEEDAVGANVAMNDAGIAAMV